MNTIYYWLQNKFELEFLREQFRDSKCKGLYIPFNFFDNEKTKDAIKESLKILDKEIILYFNYNNDLRPKLFSDKQIMGRKRLSEKESEKRRKVIEKKTEQLKYLYELCNIEEARKYIEQKYQKYLDIKEFLNNPIESDCDIDELFLEVIKHEMEIMDFEFPFITSPPTEIGSKEKGRELLYLINEVNNNFSQIQRSNKRFKDSIFNICLSIEDLKIESENYENFLNLSRQFNNISLWIINFNEIYASKEHIKLVYDFLCNINKTNKICIVKYIGIFTNQLIKTIGNNLNSVIRLNGYPGQNINLLTPITRTRRLVDPISGNYLSHVNIAERFGKDFYCNCEICRHYNVINYETAYELYLREDAENSRFYKNYIGRARKTKHAKIRKIQNKFLLKHCFINTDTDLNLNLKDFRSKYRNRAKNFLFWDELYSIGGDNS
ncbi:MAG: hypothetical protein ACFFAN_12450 [Promethearchaeota archaeon]